MRVIEVLLEMRGQPAGGALGYIDGGRERVAAHERNFRWSPVA
jgi:hypothetical protein